MAAVLVGEEVLEDERPAVALGVGRVARLADKLEKVRVVVDVELNLLEQLSDFVDDRVRDAARELVAASAGVRPSIEEPYVLPQFGDWPFAFTRIDAVYVWTQGGYQVGRDPDDYPLFLAVREQNVDAWEAFFESFDLPTAFDRLPRDELAGPLQIVLDPQPALEIEHVEGYPVVPRTETIEYMREHYTQFQSALAMLDRMYDDLDLGVTYRETERAQT
ncbi:RNA polymerase subunit sigma-70 [Haloterrigena salinisoli]|uniref:RNA polymerase subunit sigma-70 n=1 Tax=Haloterrigena salinisoli TaxID=3132747 RepID=UPI0030D31F93